ncbi:beta-lactamase/transpeptidase-like protein [Tricladium varicosporioides]|nr:beta-lactamase/transpeptidase-like protein [Hymenoscyphus varicosporioides]
MSFLSMSKFIHLVLVVLAFSSISDAVKCAPDGPLLPRPTTLHSSPKIAIAKESIKRLLDKATSGQLIVPWTVPNISFSVAFTALNSPSPSTPLFEYHHLATTNINGTKHVDGDSQYLIGSISKAVSDLLLLKSGLNVNDPITKYLPELKGKNLPIEWDQITLKSLGDHLSGMPGYYGFPEIYYLIPYFQALGFPELPVTEWPPCNVIGLNTGCSRKQLLDGFKKSHGMSAVNLRASYSSYSFTLISYALQVATGKNYSQLLHDELLIPLSMKNTGPSPGNDSKAVIPVTDNSWGADYGDSVPGGGLYSSTNDLTTLLNSLLNPHPTILPRSQILQWLKPTSFTTSLQTAVGLPWEIYRSQNLTPAHAHTIDIYTKAGAAYGYEGIIGLIEQYGVGFTVLTAGAKGQEAQSAVMETMLATLMPIVEEVTRDEAKSYAGQYTGAEGHMSTTVDNGPGLRLTSLTRNGSDIISALHLLFDSQGVSLGRLSDELRLYPTDISHEVSPTPKRDTENRGNVLIEEDWRLQYDIQDEEIKSDLPRIVEKEGLCFGWITGDAIFYAGEAVDRFVFVKEKGSGKVVGARVPALRLNLTLSS